MILRRITHTMSGQNWTAISIEFVLVVLGVFLGIMAANWNEERLERRETERLLDQLDTELTNYVVVLDTLPRYYAVTGRYAQTATAGWRGDPRISDRDFVIAAYQASQISGAAGNSSVWAAVFGADSLRDIDEPETRQGLARVMTFNYDLIDVAAVATQYREQVRKIIPDEIQVIIRAQCGDRTNARGAFLLPSTCDAELPAEATARTADQLRAWPDMVAELNWHRAATTNQLTNAATIKARAQTLANRLGK